MMEPMRLTTSECSEGVLDVMTIGDKAGRGNFRHRDAEENDAEQTIGIGKNLLDRLGLFISRFRLVFEPQAVYGHEGGLGGGKKHREHQKEDEKNDVKQEMETRLGGCLHRA